MIVEQVLDELRAEHRRIAQLANRYLCIRHYMPPEGLVALGFESFGDLPQEESIESRIDRMVDARLAEDEATYKMMIGGGPYEKA